MIEKTPSDIDPARGRRLARLREERGWSQIRLAGEIHAATDELSVRHLESLTRSIKRHEAGGPVSPQYRRAYARAHGLSPDDLFGPLATAADDAERRLAAGLARPSRLDTYAIDNLSHVLHAQRRLEDIIGSAALLGPVNAYLRTIECLLSESRGAVRPQLLAMASQWCQFAAWLAASTRQLQRAERLYDRTITWATEARDPDMIATALNMLGHLAWRTHRIPDMITRSESASQIRHTSPGVQALAAQQAARGHAITGDDRATDQLLDIAAGFIETATTNPTEEPPWTYFFDPAYFALQRARAYLYLPGRHDHAIDLLTTGIDAVPTHVRHSEWIGSYLVDLATGYYATHQYAEAARVITDVLDIAERTGAGELAARARRLSAQARQ